MPKKKTRSTDVADVRMARETRFLRPREDIIFRGGQGTIDLGVQPPVYGIGGGTAPSVQAVGTRQTEALSLLRRFAALRNISVPAAMAMFEGKTLKDLSDMVTQEEERVRRERQEFYGPRQPGSLSP